MPDASRYAKSDVVYEPLRELILCERTAGSRLNIDQVAAQLGVSATPIREALVRLEAEGLVTKVPMRGYTIAPSLDAASFVSLYEVRLLLEPRAAGLAARHRAEADLNLLADTIAEQRKHVGPGPAAKQAAFGSADAKFHGLLARASGNEYLADSVERLRAHDLLARLWIISGLPDGNESVKEHEDILVAISDRDSATARALMQAHLIRSRATLLLLTDPDVEGYERVIPDSTRE